MTNFSKNGGPALDNARTVLSWIATLFLAFMALGSLSEQLWLALVPLCVACALAVPLKNWRATLEGYGLDAKRRRAALAICTLAGFIAIGAFAKVKPQEAASTRKPSVPNSPAPSPSATAASDASTDEAKAAFLSLYRRVIDVAKPCDASIGRMGNAASTGDQYATYDLAKKGAAACRDAASAIQSMEAPDGLSADGSEATTKAIDVCRSAYIYRQMGMEKAMEVADGNGKPSVVSEMTENLKTGQDGVMLCVADFFMAAGKAGIDIKSLQKKSD